ncbi:DNA methyltransferase [Roseibium aquae]|uniref:site-specific DNA-methyltransferase (adenine-specific) n=1 Tax=Roseibium aquae TaxID=1323746 RepID=A0A916X333_9HYPH|nr:DNA adenine methylase [Roseibium aquae]GGB55417.1 DNA methyltransferase [Roseibium aquae]
MPSDPTPDQSRALETIRPVVPVAPYIGGKHRLAKRIAAKLQALPHSVYAEPFVGMGGVFFRRPFRAPCEIVNDISGDVVTLFRILQRHYPQFLEVLRFQLTSRSEFERLLKTDPNTLTDLERAARFLYIQRISFAGKVKGRTFGVSLTRGARFDLSRVVPLLEDVHERLSGVIIEQLAYGDCIARYDRPGTLFYLDPPYWDCETYYGDGVFGPQDFERLANQLIEIKGRFLLSINDAPEIRQAFGAFHIEEVDVTYSASKTRSKRVTELLISN